jgi:serine/threonine protein kinase
VDDPSLKLTQFVGTPLYQSPEQMEGLYYNEKVDIYAMGLILYELSASFKTGMERRESIDLLRSEHRLKNGFRDERPLESQLILWMTNKKNNERPTGQEIIDSEVFKSWKNSVHS